MAEMTEVAELRAKVAELETKMNLMGGAGLALEQDNRTLEREVQTLLGICGGNYKLGEDFKKVCRKYYTKEFIQSCVGGDACPVGEYFDDHDFDDESVRYSEPGVEWKPEDELEEDEGYKAMKHYKLKAEYEEFRLTMIQAVSGNPMEFECVDGLFKKYCRKYIKKEELRKIANNPDTLISKYFKTEEDFEL